VVRVLDRDDVEQLVSMADAIAVMRDAFAAADRGEAVMPPPFALHLPDVDGELHVKGAWLTRSPVFVVKTATGFYRNPARGLPVSGGMTLVYDAATGRLRALIADGGLLTELRTAAAGAVAADLLARPGARSAAVIGAGGQAHYQLRALLQVRRIEQVRVWARRREAAEQYARDMTTAGLSVSAAATAHEAVEGAEVIITATSATQPLVQGGWLAAGAHVTAVGADMPDKHELDPQILPLAGMYVPDSIEGAAACGELRHAIAAGIFGPSSVYGELGAIVSGRLPRRTSEDGLTVADLTGMGIQDAAVATLATRLAEDQGAGRDLPLGG
jgi:ornithine cyclodeaminase/alanine dehydrogenase-like protein (mu-crystallin family)